MIYYWWKKNIFHLIEQRTEIGCVRILKGSLQPAAKPVDMLTCSAINFHLAERFLDCQA